MRTKGRRALRVMAATVAAGFFLVLLSTASTPSHVVAGATSTQQCPPETNTCITVPFPCGSSACTVTAGPVTNLGSDQSIYVEPSGVPKGDIVVVAFCSISQNTTPVPVVAYPNCASSIPAPSTCVPTGTATTCPPTYTPLEWQYEEAGANAFTISIGSEYDPSGGGDQAIVSQNAQQYTTGSNTFGSFFCDGTSSFCGVEVMDMPAADASADVIGDGLPPRTAFSATSSNTVIIPLSWAPASNGCGSAAILFADASYSVQQFLPAAGEATCTESSGVAVLPTEMQSADQTGCVTGTGTSCPVADVADNAVPVSFMDDPQDPANVADLKAEEKQTGGKFAYIPIAVSATEIAFYGFAGQFPVDSYELTPAMAAGVMTTLWDNPIAQYGYPNDDLCTQLATKPLCKEKMQTGTTSQVVSTASGKFKTREYEYYQYLGKDNYSNTTSSGEQSNFAGDTAYALLNPWPANVNESKLSAMFPSTASGASYEVTGWMCAVPNVQYSVNLPWASSQTADVNDIMSAAQIVVNAEKGPLEATKNSSGQYIANNFVTQQIVADPSDCRAESALSTDLAPPAESATGIYEPSSLPLTAAHAMQGAVSGSAGGVAFSAMDSSEADFFGLLPASIENAAGQFVAPDQASIDAALADATTNKKGIVTPDYDDTSDAAAYPLPMVTYALVSTAPQPSASQAQQLTNLLTNLVNYSYKGGVGYSVPMPAGYVPLPSNLYQDAVADIAKDIIAPKTKTKKTTTTTTTTTTPVKTKTKTTPTTTTVTTAIASTGGGSTSGGAGASVANTVATTPTSSPVTVTHRVAQVAESPILLTLSGDRYVLPVLLALAIVCLIGGPLLYLVPSARRRLWAATGRNRLVDPEREMRGR